MSEFGELQKHKNNPHVLKVSRVFRELKLDTIQKKKKKKNLLDGIRELGIGDQEGGDAFLVQQRHEGIDLWVHDGLPHQRQRAVLRLHALCKTVSLHARHTCTQVPVTGL